MWNRSRLPCVACEPHTAICSGSTLGHGCISRDRRVWRVRITLDSQLPRHHRPPLARRSRVLMPGQRAGTWRRSDNCTEVYLCSKHWPCLFPQHGPGKKHLRPIRLEPWQEVLVKEATEEFIRGLIDSDGCRVVANDRGVRSVRHHFSNRSDDIRGLFCAALDEPGSRGHCRAGSRSPSIGKPRSRA